MSSREASPSTPIAAQVVLRSAVHDRSGVRAATVHDALPQADDVREARRAFTALGFVVGPLVGDSFSIAADPKRFATVFGLAIGRGADGGIHDATGNPVDQLPLDQLPRDLAFRLRQVLFTRPPAFGPGVMP